MSLYAALEKITETITLDGFPPMEIGVPAAAQNLAHPKWYLDLPDEDYEYAAMQAVHKTKTYVLAPLFLVVNEIDRPPDTKNLGQWLANVLVPDIVEQFEQAARDRTFANDEDVGSEICVRKVIYDWRPTSPVAVVRLEIEIRAFGN